MGTLVFVAASVVVLLVVSVIYTSFKRQRRQRENTSEVINYDRLQERFIYRIPIDSRRLLEKLRSTSIFDTLEYEVDERKSQITFCDRRDKLTYSFSVDCENGAYIFRLRQCGSRIGLKKADRLIRQLNPFWKEKCGAVPLPYEQYGEEENGTL